MAAWVILGALAAFGALCALWVLFGALLPGQRGTVMVCLQPDPDAAVRRHRWLRDLGLLRCPVIVVDAVGADVPGVEYIEMAALTARLEQEREKLGRTGT